MLGLMWGYSGPEGVIKSDSSYGEKYRLRVRCNHCASRRKWPSKNRWTFRLHLWSEGWRWKKVSSYIFPKWVCPKCLERGGLV